MNADNSIFDKLIQSKQQQEASQFDPSDIVASLFKNLNSKERDILSRRFGLMGNQKETLEKIGAHYEITRERIRQIESNTIKKLKALQEFEEHIKVAEHNVRRLLESYGGIMEENHLLDELLTYTDANDSNRQASLFILENLLNDRIDRVKANRDMESGWKLPAFPLELIQSALEDIVGLIKEYNELLETEKLVETITTRPFFPQYKETLGTHLKYHDPEESAYNGLQSHLRISKKVNQNILGEWGLSRWTSVRPKRMGDKVYLVLRKAGKPLHFTEIADRINEANFDNKKAYPATIHNELILDKRYILVGRGIYALKEWGYKSGTVLDVVVDILAKAGKPLTRDQIIDEVLKQRIVRKSTILLALNNKERIKKLPDNTYTVAQ